jgi:hypothetical protein
MKVDELIEYYPRLYHMAENDSWPNIRQSGLLSTASLTTLFEVPEPERTQLLTEHRPRSVVLKHPMHGQVVIRDQKPLQPSKLERLLTDMSVAQWIRLLNGYVYFWLHPERVQRLLNARAYRNHAHLVLTVDTRSLVSAYEDHIYLSGINSGATPYLNGLRGSTTFQRIIDFRHPRPRSLHSPPKYVAELAVVGAIPDILEHVVEVQRRCTDLVLETMPLSRGMTD